ncbi:MAG: GFA family protein [Proteobacteria bacterium]|nr:GFA family protein [Pseudomonadota bacterium]
MKLTGGCYCGQLRYEAEGEPMLKAQCHCRECQYITGGAPNMFMLMPVVGFRYTKGEPKKFSRSDLEKPVTREFCANCGTHIVTHPNGVPGMLVLKVGTLDDPKQYDGPRMAIYTIDKQSFHMIPEGIPAFERVPG